MIDYQEAYMAAGREIVRLEDQIIDLTAIAEAVVRVEETSNPAIRERKRKTLHRAAKDILVKLAEEG